MKRTKSVLRIFLSLFILESAFAVHEYGHLTEFQRRGIPVEEFSLGIGPRLYKYQSHSYVLSFRLIPIMAYVKATHEGSALFESQGSLRDKIIVDLAGVRNNFIVGILILYFLQFLGWRRGNVSLRELTGIIVVTPFKIFLRFFSFLLGCLTWGRLDYAENFFLSTGGITPPRPLNKLIRWNLGLGLFNLVPLSPLDGGHAVQAILLSSGFKMPEIPSFACFVLFVLFYMSANDQDMRVLETEAKN